jgi:hypothetical protein
MARYNTTLIAKVRDRWYVPDPNKAGDLEKLRERALLKEFEEYKSSGKSPRSSAWKLSAPDSRKPGRNANTPSSSPWPTRSPTTSWKKIPSCSCGTTRQ